MRLAVFQCPAMRDDAAGTTRHALEALDAAGGDAIDLALFPEAFLPGHSYDADVIAARADRAEAAIAAFCVASRDLATTIVLGAFVREQAGIANAALVIEEGEVVGRYVKACPNEPGVVAGRDFPVFVRDRIRFGINICADANHPDAAQRLADGGAELILYPLDNMLSPDIADRWRTRSPANLVARARQTGCWVASADVVGARDGLRSYGCSAIVSPAGEIVARVPEDTAGAACYDVSPP